MEHSILKTSMLAVKFPSTISEKKYLSNDNKLSQKMIIIILIVNKICATTGHCGLFVAQGNINIHIPAQT